MNLPNAQRARLCVLLQETDRLLQPLRGQQHIGVEQEDILSRSAFYRLIVALRIARIGGVGDEFDLRKTGYYGIRASIRRVIIHHNDFKRERRGMFIDAGKRVE